MIEDMTNDQLAELYLEWFNGWNLEYMNFLTVERFAEYKGCTVDEANAIIYYGREAHKKTYNRGIKMNDKDTVEDLHQDFLEDISLKDAISALSRGALPAVVLMRYRNTVINEVIKKLQDDQK